MSGLPPGHPDPELDEELAYHLDRGAALLEQGELEPARESLERARVLEPRSERVLGLLGQALYKLGRYAEAAEIYGVLVDQNPAEAAARVNLGLSSLKARRLPEAVRQLEIALDLAPDHKKAMGYLGLAWLEQREVRRAREWFERAGSDQMVVRCDEILAGKRPAWPAPARRPRRPGAPRVVPPPMPASAPRAAGAAEPTPDPAAPPAPAAGEPTGLAAFLGPRRVGPAGERRFTLAAGRLNVSVRQDVLVRAEGLLAICGPVRLAPEMKRFRGQPTQRPFGEGARRMLRASGAGELVYRAAARLSVVGLARDAAYFREEVVFAFEDAVTFDNGRVTSRLGPDLNLVHLRGDGQVVLATCGDVAALEVPRGGAVRVPLPALVGWTGALTPRLAPLGEPAGPEPEPLAGEPLVVELSGEGEVLLDEGAAS